jgi:phosphopantothenoylcysteine decarboxylase / phosphopantothenate---cysteine ligase
MQGKKILIGITGSIAAYKIPQLVRLLIKNGAEVKIMMTPAATDFVSSLVLGTLSKHAVLIDMFDKDTWSNHVMLGRWADVLLIAPASCNTLAKMTTGQCDNFLLATYMSATCPVMIAPAMDEDMWHHKATQQNLQWLKQNKHIVLDAEHGELASGLVGMGRMAEPESILEKLALFFEQGNDLLNKKILITAGPTYENIDPVRFIGNHSSGKMGIAIAEACAQRGALVHLVLGPSKYTTVHSNISTYKVTNAQEMYTQCVALWPTCDIGIMSAAVADYTPTIVAEDKIKKTDNELTITLTKTKDILKYLGEHKQANQTLVGFALESKDEKNYALQKLEKKNADLIVLNSVRDEGAGFGTDTNKITIFTKQKQEIAFDLKNKQEVAHDIINTILNYQKK